MIFEAVRHLLSGQSKHHGAQVLGGAAIGSVIGRVRSDNQDRALVVEFEYSAHPAMTCAAVIVSDGIGGMNDGAIAAEIAVSAFVEFLSLNPRLGPEQRMYGAVTHANNLVFKNLKGKGGATLVAALVAAHRPPCCVSVGDSRIYQFDLARHYLTQLSQDDNLGALVNLRKNIRVDPAQASHLTQYIGVGEGIDPNIFWGDSGESKLLLTSDGAHGIGHTLISEFIQRIDDNLSIVQAILSTANYMGGKDNSTAGMVSLPYRLPQSDGKHSGLKIRIKSPGDSLEIWQPAVNGAGASASRSGETRVRDERREKEVSKNSPTQKKRPPRKRKVKVTIAKVSDELKLDFPDGE